VLFESGQFRRWVLAGSDRQIGIVRLISEVWVSHTRNFASAGCWYVEDVKTGITIMLSPSQIGDIAPDLEVIAAHSVSP
jgi:hypothetical protein